VHCSQNIYSSAYHSGGHSIATIFPTITILTFRTLRSCYTPLAPRRSNAVLPANRLYFVPDDEQFAHSQPRKGTEVYLKHFVVHGPEGETSPQRLDGLVGAPVTLRTATLPLHDQVSSTAHKHWQDYALCFVFPEPGPTHAMNCRNGDAPRGSTTFRA
jgi:hypothetical protein